MRARGDRTPVLMLTARDATEDRVEGLNVGADDYLVKPFTFAELAARLSALQRRPPLTARPGADLRRPGLRPDHPDGDPGRASRSPSRPSRPALLELLLRRAPAAGQPADHRRAGLGRRGRPGRLQHHRRPRRHGSGPSCRRPPPGSRRCGDSATGSSPHEAHAVAPRSTPGGPTPPGWPWRPPPWWRWSPLLMVAGGQSASCSAGSTRTSTAGCATLASTPATGAATAGVAAADRRRPRRRPRRSSGGSAPTAP